MLASREAFSLCRFSRSESSLFAYPEAWSLAQRAPWVNPHLLEVPTRHLEQAGNGQSDAQLHLVHAAAEVALKAEAVVDAVGDSLQCGAPAVAPMRARAALGRRHGASLSEHSPVWSGRTLRPWTASPSGRPSAPPAENQSSSIRPKERQQRVDRARRRAIRDGIRRSTTAPLPAAAAPSSGH